MLRRPPGSTLFPTRRSSDLSVTQVITQLIDEIVDVWRFDLNKRHLPEVWQEVAPDHAAIVDRKSTRLNSSHQIISYAVFCLKKKNRHRRSKSHKRSATKRYQ